MEVHHHTHSGHGKKSWKAYFWEFLMLFLAVFCGFLAEYKLEHVIEHTREKEYIRSMLEDLGKDTANLSSVINNFQENENRLDNLMLRFDDGIKVFNNEWTKEFVLFALSGYEDFVYTDRTLQQLKNSGGLRLIRNKIAAAGIIGYDAAIRDLYGELKLLAEYQSKYDEIIHKIWSFRQMYTDLGSIKLDRGKDIELKKNYWMSNNPEDYEYLFNKTMAYRDGFNRIRILMLAIKDEANSLISVLKKEYRFD